MTETAIPGSGSARTPAMSCTASMQALDEDGAVGQTLNMHGPYAIPFSEATPVLSDLLGLPVLDWEAPACWQYWGGQ